MIENESKQTDNVQCDFQYGHLPRGANQVNSNVQLHKKGDCNDPSNYRGISVLNSLNKVCASVQIARCRSGHKKKKTIFTEAQVDFMQRYSATDHIFILVAIIEKQFSRNAKF